MNKLNVIVTFLLVAVNAIAQETTNQSLPDTESSKVAITLGVLQGGGGILGADFEFMVAPRFSLQAGAGLTSFGAGINYHLKPSIRSSMISLTYWHQGINESYTQSLIGPSYVFRAKRLFTAQFGLGYLVEEGPAWPSNKDHPSAMLLYSLGVYLPVK